MEDTDAKRLNKTPELLQTRYLENRLQGIPMKESATLAGYTGRMADAPGKLIESAELRARYQQMAREKGLTIDRMGDKVVELLDARANQTLEGKQVTQSEAPDYKVQMKALELHANLMGLNDASKVAGGGSSITVSVTGAAADRLLAAFEGREE